MSESQASALDHEALEALRASVEGDRAFVEELIEAFLSDGSAHLTDVEAALAAADAAALVRPAHTLKSSSATVGATKLSALARELEMAGRSGTLDDATLGRAPELRTAWAEASAALRAWVSGGIDR